MKYKVIGWTDYDDMIYDVDTGHASDAATQAIIDDIIANEYCFTGYDHQESRCCVPVLNDGKKRLYSQRGFGALMAQAHGYNGTMDYARFSFTPYDAYIKENRDGMPPLDLQFDPSTFVYEDITQDYTLQVSAEQYARAVTDGEIVIEDSQYIRFMDKGDRVTLVYGDKSVCYTVTDVTKDKDLSEDDMIALYAHREGAEQKWQNAKIIATIRFEHFKPKNI